MERDIYSTSCRTAREQIDAAQTTCQRPMISSNIVQLRHAPRHPALPAPRPQNARSRISHPPQMADELTHAISQLGVADQQNLSLLDLTQQKLELNGAAYLENKYLLLSYLRRGS